MNYSSAGPAQMAQRAMPGHRPQQMPATNAPPGTFAPGTKVQVGGHRVVIEKYLSEGGFAHVYVVRVPVKDSKYETAVLKRVAVPDKEALANMRTEVETMKKLQGHKHIVRYIDSHASQLKGGGYEVFLLMEFCAGGGLIDFMNTRLQYRLTEPEILKIFSDVSEGVATMHYLKPPLLHRDLKVENVLISAPPATNPNALYKLCDFGSTAPPRPAATNASEARLIEDDIQRHTTMQYRSPEMVDVWRKQPIDEKSDIWALGVLLYKLCYYTTPFEEVGQMAILNARFKFPHHPFFSERLRKLISAMLKEDPKHRPNIYQVIKEVCSIRNTPVPIKDIYSNRSRSEDVKNQRLPPSSPQVKSPAPVGISHITAKEEKEVLPDITPMRRGRPTAPTQQPAAKPSPSPVKGDPFAALDSNNQNVRAVAVDELSKKFPSLDEFSITMDKGPSFDFNKSASRTPAAKTEPATNVPADSGRETVRPSQVKANERPSTSATARGSARTAAASTNDHQQPVQRTPVRSNYVSTGTMTSSTPPPQSKPVMPAFSARPIWRVPSHGRSESQPRPSTGASDHHKSAASAARSLQPSPRPEMQASRSPLPSQRPPTEPKLSSENDSEVNLSRAQSTKERSRPASAAYVGSNLDYLRDHESNAIKSPPALGSRRSSRQQLPTVASPEESKPIKNDTAYLRSLEEDEDRWQRQNLNSMSIRDKTASVPPAMMMEGATRYSTKDSITNEVSEALPARSSSPQRQYPQRPLSPIAPSEATSSPKPNLIDIEGSVDVDDMSPEMRREMERQLQSQEERRVADAAAAYRGSNGGAPAGASRTTSIQQRMQSLLDEGRSTPVTRTAAGYGRYTDDPSDSKPVPRRALPDNAQVISPTDYAQPRRGYASSPKPQESLVVERQRPDPEPRPIVAHAPVSASAPPGINRTGPRPAAKPKPMGLRSGMTGQKTSAPQSPIKSPNEERTAEWQNAANSKSQGSRLAMLLAKDQEGVADAGPGDKPLYDLPDEPAQDSRPTPAARLDVETDLDGKDWEMEFSKRYPSLSGIELVETGIGGLPSNLSQREVRVKDV
ncbi:Serine/threonine-protein kinase plo1 [Elsinoe australis]|uniref:non-specific serine/threonine protein kinase n=1 Tax=Elsinoe australis TaxID=40998 RepID=A0A2P7YDH9_9PEZI|nr:Serine/threonine-protein kinase plo1 [Elsinoe australis]